MVANDVSMPRELMNFCLKTYPPNVAFPHLLVYSRTILIDFLAHKVNFNCFRFCPIVKFMISLSKLTMRGAGPIFFFINCEILVQYYVGIDTAFSTMGYLLAHFSVVLVQPNGYTLSVNYYK